jgi:hypothetical protein
VSFPALEPGGAFSAAKLNPGCYVLWILLAVEIQYFVAPELNAFTLTA